MRGGTSKAIMCSCRDLSADPQIRRLSPAGWQESDGRTPRFFALDPAGRILFAANEDSDSIVPFGIDRRSGTLRRSGEPVRVGSPVCILYMRA